MRRAFRSIILSCVFVCMASTAFAFSEEDVQVIARDYAVDPIGVRTLYESKWNWQDINRAAFLSLASQEPLEVIVRYKQIAGEWKDAEGIVGITSWHIKLGQERLICNQLHDIVGISKGAVQDALKQRYHPQAIALSAAIAMKSSADLSETLAMKRDHRTWYQLGEELGLKAKEVDALMQDLQRAFARRTAVGDAYGYYGQVYGYRDSDYYSGGMDLDVIDRLYHSRK